MICIYGAFHKMKTRIRRKLWTNHNHILSLLSSQEVNLRARNMKHFLNFYKKNKQETSLLTQHQQDYCLHILTNFDYTKNVSVECLLFSLIKVLYQRSFTKIFSIASNYVSYFRLSTQKLPMIVMQIGKSNFLIMK